MKEKKKKNKHKIKHNEDQLQDQELRMLIMMKNLVMKMNNHCRINIIISFYLTLMISI